MKRLLSLLPISVAILATALLLAQEPRVHLIHLDPQPSISGGCPARAHFSGHIEVTGPMEVTYQWLRSDGSSTEHTVNFNRAGSRPISTEWTISKNYAGWMQLVILSPRRMQTQKSMFSVHCGR